MKKTKTLLFFILSALLAFASYLYSESAESLADKFAAENNESPEAAAQAGAEEGLLLEVPTAAVSGEQMTAEPTSQPTPPPDTYEQQPTPTVPPPPVVTEEPTSQPDSDLPTPVPTQPAQEPAAAPTQEEKVNKIEIDNTAYGEEEGIVILNPGQTSLDELEKYIVSKKKTTPVEDEAGEETEVNVTFEGPDYDEGETGGIILMEADGNSKIEKAGYVMVERAGFISDNFTEDGFIYDVDDREILTQGMPAYIRITVGKSIKKGMQFLIYTDKEAVEDMVTGRDLGRLIDIRGVGKVIEKAEEGLWKVSVVKNYGPINQNFKIKLRNDFKEYYNKLTTRIKKKTGVIEAFIIKVQHGIVNIKKKDIVYLNKGVKDGLMPGEKVTVYRSIPNKETGANDVYHKTGTLIVINSMKDSSVAVVSEMTGIINAGDMVKTSK